MVSSFCTLVFFWTAPQQGEELNLAMLVGPFQARISWNIPLVFLFSCPENPPVAFTGFIAFYGTCNSGISLLLHNQC